MSKERKLLAMMAAQIAAGTAGVMVDLPQEIDLDEVMMRVAKRSAQLARLILDQVDGQVDNRHGLYKEFFGENGSAAMQREMSHDQSRDRTKTRPMRATMLFKDAPLETVFKFTSPEPHWATGYLVKRAKIPGWAMPEGWDFALADDPEFQNAVIAVYASMKAPEQPPFPDIPSPEHA